MGFKPHKWRLYKNRPHHKQWCWHFFRSMNRYIPHTRESMRDISRLCWCLIPGAAQQVVDEVSNIANVHAAILVTVGSFQIHARCIAAKQVVNQCGYIADVHIAVAVHITAKTTERCSKWPNWRCNQKGFNFEIKQRDLPVICGTWTKITIYIINPSFT